MIKYLLRENAEHVNRNEDKTYISGNRILKSGD